MSERKRLEWLSENFPSDEDLYFLPVLDGLRERRAIELPFGSFDKQNFLSFLRGNQH